MIECQSLARKWGSSIGLTIPKEVVDKAKIKENKLIKFLIVEDESPIKKTFGILKDWKKPTKKIIRDMRSGSWDE